MARAAGIILAGGRSSRMGAPKAALEWHGSTLLRRVTGVVGRVVDGPIIVVRAPGQRLPDLAERAELVSDDRTGKGPMQGIAAGLAAIDDRAPLAYVSSTDVPLLHPAFVRRVIAAAGGEVDVVLPEIGGYRQPLAAVYRSDLLGTVQELIAAERMSPAFLFERCRVRRLDDQTMLADRSVARFDPELASVHSLNEPAEYERAHALPAPEIHVELCGPFATRAASRRRTARAWTLGQLASAVEIALDEHVVVALNGDQVSRDSELPLVAGDTVGFGMSHPGG